MSGTGSAAMEASIANFIEPGEKISIAKKGYFGDRLVDMASRYKADVSVIEKQWGEAFSFEEIKYEIETNKPSIFAIVHAETSTKNKQLFFLHKSPIPSRGCNTPVDVSA